MPAPLMNLPSFLSQKEFIKQMAHAYKRMLVTSCDPRMLFCSLQRKTLQRNCQDRNTIQRLCVTVKKTKGHIRLAEINGEYNSRDKVAIAKHVNLQGFHYQLTLLEPDFVKLHSLEIALKLGDIMTPLTAKNKKYHCNFSSFELPSN